MTNPLRLATGLVAALVLFLQPARTGVAAAASQNGSADAPPLIADAAPSGFALIARRAAIVPLVGEIDDYTRDDLIRRFDKAKAMGATVIVIDINSPGGLVTSSLDISHFLKSQDDVHTIAFVRDKAYSGAAMVAMACNEIWMAPVSALGDCAPISISASGGLQPLPAAERAKEQSPIIKDFEDSARRNGYSLAIAQAMVDVNASVYLLQNTAGDKRIVDEAGYHKLTQTSQWTPVPGFDNPIDGPTTLLTVYPKEAMALGLARGTARSAHALLADHQDTLVADLTPGIGEKLVEWLNNPVVRSILLLIFLQSLYIAIHAPGHGAAEAVAVVSLGLLIGVPLLTGYAQWWEVGVIFVGLALCAFEIFVFPGHFVSLILGTLMVVFGLVMTFVGKEPTGVPGWLPTMQQTWHGVQNGVLAVFFAMVGWIVLSMWIRRFLPSIPYFNKLILTATTANKATLPVPGDHPPQENWPFIGTIGVALTDLRPGGSVEFPFADATRPAAVVSMSGYVPRGTRVAVEEIDGSSVRVRAIG